MQHQMKLRAIFMWLLNSAGWESISFHFKLTCVISTYDINLFYIRSWFQAKGKLKECDLQPYLNALFRLHFVLGVTQYFFVNVALKMF